MRPRRNLIVITGPHHSGRTILARFLSERLGIMTLPEPWSPPAVERAGNEPMIFDGCPLIQSHCNSDMMGPAHVGAAHPTLLTDAIVIFCFPRFGALRNVDFGASRQVYDRWAQAKSRWPGMRATYRWDDATLREVVVLCRFEVQGVSYTMRDSQPDPRLQFGS